ncbi:hypothetical protein HELRODRAFT_182385 [Helobdella robusta]|uniref:beta-N-acetylhexosaminidase n=1 Tax=Helobdella robusta TaxID=6412 RepID=T1FI44_HELRO|nr:hypothetical protein HELRODRAFT_182385 [Helobdella robusta]ESN91037.1 hypothetical protein HELRODRAFT_182385 [Helobdella robusta]
MAPSLQKALSGQRVLRIPGRYAIVEGCCRKIQNGPSMVLRLGMLNTYIFISVDDFVEDYVITSSFNGTDAEYISKYLAVKFVPVDEKIVNMKLINRGSRDILCTKWKIYFSLIVVSECCDSQVCFERVNGYLFKLFPFACEAGSVILKKHSSRVMVYCDILLPSIYFVFPNWFVVGPDLKSFVLHSSKFRDPSKIVSTIPSYSSRSRFIRNSHLNCNRSREKNFYKNFVLPSPMMSDDVSKLKVTRSLVIDDTWIICIGSPVLNEAAFLARYLKIKTRDIDQCSSTSELTPRTIVLKANEELDGLGFDAEDPRLGDGYVITLTTRDVIVLKAKSAAGIFYGVQSLISMLSDGAVIFYDGPVRKVVDVPRYKYRGLLLDVGRHFLDKSYIKRTITVMSQYKLNVLHLHLTDDEGWRLQIPSIPELTEVGSHPRLGPESDRVDFLYPYLGSIPKYYNDSQSATGPLNALLNYVYGDKNISYNDDDVDGNNFNRRRLNTKGQYYTCKDYRDILRHAVRHHVTILPEIDFPGHSHAAIVSMRARRRRQRLNRKLNVYERARQFIVNSSILAHRRDALLQKLTDAQKNFGLESDDEVFEGNSVNCGKHTVINVCLPSSMQFISTVVQTVVNLHKDIQPLKMIHLGGDEVPSGAFDLKSCKNIIKNDSNEALSAKQVNARALEYIVDVGRKYGLEVIMWGSDMMNLMERKLQPDAVNFWLYSNDQTNGQLESSLQNLARLQHSTIILSDASSFYVDHPYEPSNEERGLTWSTDFIDDFSILSYKEPQFLQDPTMKRKILGHPKFIDTWLRWRVFKRVQLSLWGELILSEVESDYMLYPRMLAFAQYAWSQAEFMLEKGKRCRMWNIYADMLVRKELKRLDDLKVEYRVPLPGARVIKNDLSWNVVYPGLSVEASLDEGATWVAARRVKAKNIKDHLLLSTLFVLFNF